jgi:zinc protease
MHDRVANVRLYRSWAVPGLLEPASVPLEVGAAVLGGLASSRLDNALVRGDGAAVFATASLTPLQRVGMFTVIVEVSPGFDPEEVGARMDTVLADLIEHGPTEDEVQRVATRQVSRIAGLEQVGGFGGKAVALAEGTLYAGDPAFYRSQLQAYATVTPGEVAGAMQRWLRRPGFVLRVEPGAREPYEEAAGTRGAVSEAPAQDYTPVARGPMPEIGPVADLRFPAIERATLSNGVEIVYARSASVPAVRVAVEFDAGLAADPDGQTGLQRLMLDLLTEGTTTLDSTALAEAQERLGASIGTDLSLDRTAVTLVALTPNLEPSLDLLAEVVRHPAFAPAEIERLRARQLAAIASELTQPAALGQRVLVPALYGDQHPYGRPPGGLGTTEVVSAISRDDLTGFHATWFVPARARIFAVGDVPLPTLAGALEARFGGWETPAGAGVTKRTDAPIPEPRPRVLLVDRPQSPQSLILGGLVLPVTGRDDLLTLATANEVVGSGFLSRINTDLREVKGWSYGLSGNLSLREHRTPYLIQAPVQADRTGDSIAALLEQYDAFLGEQGVTEEELVRTINGNTRRLAGSFETSASVLGALRGLALYNRPDDYWERVAGRYHAIRFQEDS